MKFFRVIIVVVIIALVSYGLYVKSVLSEIGATSTTKKSPRKGTLPITIDGINLLPYADSADDLIVYDAVSFFGGEWITFKLKCKKAIKKDDIIEKMHAESWDVGKLEKWKFPREIISLTKQDLIFIKSISSNKLATQRISISEDSHSMYIYLEIAK
jgi:hypothetical protein